MSFFPSLDGATVNSGVILVSKSIVAIAILLGQDKDPSEFGDIGIWGNILVQWKGKRQAGSNAAGRSFKTARAARDRVNGHLVNEIASGHAMACLGQEKLIPVVCGERKHTGRHPHADIYRKIPSQGVVAEMACLPRGSKAFVVKWELKS